MRLISSLLSAIALVSAVNAHAALIGSADGLTVYDTDLNVTWLSNANLAATNTFGLSYGVNYGTIIGNGDTTVINSNGTMTSAGAIKWITALNAANYLGYNDWRLPVAGNCLASYFCTDSDLGHLFYNELGGVAGQLLNVSHNSNYDLFQNMSLSIPTPYGYSLIGQFWAGTMTMQPWQAQYLDLGGYQYQYIYGQLAYTMVVRSGQVDAVPVPAAAWLFGTSLLGLTGLVRKRGIA
ncbi:MAG TPA: hypothetical protein VLC91_14045 [Spongiibacteraceae bacterium]|nr:hypothetical protein [Spongiibacteraceae bacterium]